MKRLIIISILVLIPTIYWSQTDEKREIVEQFIEYLNTDDENSDIDYTALVEDLYYYVDKPLNINKLDNIDVLSSLNILNAIQSLSLKNHIAKNGQLISIYELQAVPGFELNDIQRIIPFIKVSDQFDKTHISISEILKNSKSEIYFRVIRTLEEQKGYSPISDSALSENPNQRYLGSANDVFLRYRFRFLNKISFGFSGQKDPGEEFFKGSQKNGFDFYSAHFFIQDFGKLKALSVGDFHMQLGQGLTIWSGLSFGKGADISTIKRNPPGIRPYASIDENNFLRGIASKIEINKFNLTGFVSRKRIDANISDTIPGSQQELVFSSVQTSGYHRTEAELNDKDAIIETHIGGRAGFKNKSLDVGLLGLVSNYGGNFQKNSKIYNQFEFSNSSNSVFGLDYNYVYRNLNFFGEVSRSENGGKALVSGVLASLDPKLSISLLYRNYERNFQNLLSNAIAEGSQNVNEKGFLLGASAQLSKYWSFNGYYDLFTFPWLKSQISQINSSGNEFLAQLKYRPSRNMNLYFRVRQQSSPRNSSLSETISSLDYNQQTNYRFNIEYKISPSFKLKNRFETVKYTENNQSSELGYLIYQDVVFQPLQSPFSFTFRYALFDTESFNSRIYAYENDILYYFYIPGYYYKGSRTYLTLRYQYKKTIDIWVRYGQWLYNNKESISSGLNEIQGSSKSDIKLLLRIMF